MKKLQSLVDVISSSEKEKAKAAKNLKNILLNRGAITSEYERLKTIEVNTKTYNRICNIVKKLDVGTMSEDNYTVIILLYRKGGSVYDLVSVSVKREGAQEYIDKSQQQSERGFNGRPR